MTKRRAIVSSVLTFLLIGIAAWAFGFFSRTDPAIAELQQMGDQMRDKNLTDAQRNQLRTDFRQRMDSMTDEQRRAFFDANRDQWSGRMQQRMDEYFAMSKADQQKRLDDILNRMAQAQKSPQGNRNRGAHNMTDAQREERSKRRLDRTTPKMRAEFSEFRRQLDARAQQRGIQVGNQGGGYGGFGRGA